MEPKTHWLQNPNKNYLGHWDLPNGDDLTLTIKSAKWEEVKNPKTNKSESKRVIRFDEDVKPMICNETNSLMITKSTGVNFMEDSGGKKITLYVAKFIKGKISTDCIRIREEKSELPELLPSDTDNWNKVKQALLNGYTVDQIKTKWNISESNQEQLISETL